MFFRMLLDKYSDFIYFGCIDFVELYFIMLEKFVKREIVYY